MPSFFNRVSTLPLTFRKGILISNDIFVIFLSLFIVLEPLAIIEKYSAIQITRFILVTIIVSIIFNQLFGNYKSLTRFIRSKFLYKNILTNFVTVIIINFLSIFFFEDLLNANEWVLFWILNTSLTCFSRLIFRDLIFKFQNISVKNRKNVIIYGAGDAGVSLYDSIVNSKNYNILAFVEDSPIEYLKKLSLLSCYHDREQSQYGCQVTQNLQ